MKETSSLCSNTRDTLLTPLKMTRATRSPTAPSPCRWSRVTTRAMLGVTCTGSLSNCPLLTSSVQCWGRGLGSNWCSERWLVAEYAGARQPGNLRPASQATRSRSAGIVSGGGGDTTQQVLSEDCAAVSLIVLNYSPKTIQARCDPPLEIEVKVREDFTVTDKAFSWLKYKTLLKGTSAKHLKRLNFLWLP